MKNILLFLLLTIFADDINKIATVNRIKKEADEAYQNENYLEAAQKYSILVDSLGQKDDKLLLNLSNAYFKNNDTTNAKYLYYQLTDTKDPEIKSLAYQQLGIMANSQKKYRESLFHFKNSLMANPQNEDSRYNYELLKKLMDNQQNQDQQNQQDQSQEKNKDQEQQDQEQEQEQQQNDQNKDEQENQQNQQGAVQDQHHCQQSNQETHTLYLRWSSSRCQQNFALPKTRPRPAPRPRPAGSLVRARCPASRCRRTECGLSSPWPLQRSPPTAAE